MAEAQKPIEAPSKKAKTKAEERAELEQKWMNTTFDPDKRYVFELAAKATPRGNPIMVIENGRQYALKPKQFNHKTRNLVYTSQIIWGGQRRGIRYYDGCNTLFINEQPTDLKQMEAFMKQTRRREFTEGKLVIDGSERMLLIYMYICSWNVESPFKTKTSSDVFRPSDSSKIAVEESGRLDSIEHAIKLSKEASDIKVIIHSRFLGISDMDDDSGQQIELDRLRVLYRKKAIEEPAEFLESYGDKKLEVKYYIEKAVSEGHIDTKFNPNKASWRKSNSIICDLMGMRSDEGIKDRLFEFSQTPEGEEFLLMLKSLYER